MAATEAARAVRYARSNASRFLAELREFIRFPSVSSDPARAADVRGCAIWLAGHLRSIGLTDARVIPTRRHPLVLAHSPAVPQRPRVLIYGHYDVQPADPLSEWRSPPFRPMVRGEYLYGRGASDDKGQLFAHVKALESWLRQERGPPLNVTCVFEGEEESGSGNLLRFARENPRALAADAVVISDMPMAGRGRPAITYAMRGSLSLELEVRGPRRDLHSGIFGGAVLNPLQALADVIHRLHAPDGRVSIPGFYRDVRRWSQAERAYMASVGPSDKQVAETAGVRAGWGEPGFTHYEHTTIRPALTVNGISGGHAGAGSKAVIPSRASAKLSFRLVPDQDPDDVERLLRRQIATLTPPTCEVSVRREFGSEPVLIDRASWPVRSAYLACRSVFATAPVFLRLGGTIPIIGALQQLIDAPIVLMGFALPDDGLHAPNERFHVPTFYQAIEACTLFLAGLAASSVRPRLDIGPTGLRNLA